MVENFGVTLGFFSSPSDENEQRGDERASFFPSFFQPDIVECLQFPFLLLARVRERMEGLAGGAAILQRKNSLIAIAKKKEEERKRNPYFILSLFLSPQKMCPKSCNQEPVSEQDTLILSVCMFYVLYIAIFICERVNAWDECVLLFRFTVHFLYFMYFETIM